MYEQYLADKNSVDKTWWPVLEHYHPGDTEAAPQPTSAPARRSTRPRSRTGARRRPGAARPAPPRSRARGTR